MRPRLAGQVAGDVADAAFRRGDLDVDDRLEHDRRAPCAIASMNALLAGGDEGDFLGVDRVVLAVVDDRRARPAAGSRRSAPSSSTWRTPFSTAGMNWLGIVPPMTSSTNSKPAAARAAARCAGTLRRTGPRRRSASCAGDGLRPWRVIVSRYAICGGWVVDVDAVLARSCARARGAGAARPGRASRSRWRRRRARRASTDLPPRACAALSESFCSSPRRLGSIARP